MPPGLFFLRLAALISFPVTVIAVLLSISILLVWVIFVAFAVSPSVAKSGSTPINGHDEIGEMHKVIQSIEMAMPATYLDMKIAPMFDTTGAVVSNPTEIILSVINL